MAEEKTSEHRIYKEFLLSLRGTTSPEHCETLAALVAVLWAISSEDTGTSDPSYLARAWGRAQIAMRWLTDRMKP